MMERKEKFPSGILILSLLVIFSLALLTIDDTLHIS